MTYPCEANIRAPKLICGGAHCTNYVNTDEAKRICKCTDADGREVPGCQPKTDSYPIETASCYNKVTKAWKNISDDDCQAERDRDKNWSWKQCFCCCSCVAWGTLVKVRTDIAMPIEGMEQGDTVLAARMSANGTDPLSITWSSRKVTFSDGTSPAEVEGTVLIVFGADGELLCTGDQPLVTAEGKLIEAKYVYAGLDLLGDGGEAVKVLSVDLGVNRTGLWHIATDAQDMHSLDDHLVSFNGLVAGDFIVQSMMGASNSTLHVVDGDLPVIGTKDYAQRHGGSATNSVAIGNESRPQRAANFVSYRTLNRVALPPDAVRFVNEAQAKDIEDFADIAPISSGYNLPNFEYLVRLYKGLYPSVHIVTQWEMKEPNLLAFHAYGLNIVVVSGELLRARCLEQEGLALILGHGIGRFIGGAPADEAGYACAGQADHFAAGYIINQTFYGNSTDYLKSGIRQVCELFASIQKDNRGGTDRCDEPSIACRIQSLKDAQSGKNLPYCAGAPVPGALQLLTAQALSVADVTGLELTFNLPLKASSVTDVTRYTITPVSSVLTAMVDALDPTRALLTVRFPQDVEQEFSIAVSNLRASDGSSLDPEHSVVTFRVVEASSI